MNVRDLTPEQRRELLAAWDAAVAYLRDRVSSDRVAMYAAYAVLFRRLSNRTLESPIFVAHGF